MHAIWLLSDAIHGCMFVSETECLKGHRALMHNMFIINQRLAGFTLDENFTFLKWTQLFHIIPLPVCLTPACSPVFSYKLRLLLSMEEETLNAAIL